MQRGHTEKESFRVPGGRRWEYDTEQMAPTEHQSIGASGLEFLLGGS